MRHFVLLVLLCLGGLQAVPQSIPLQHFTTRNSGLVQNQVMKINRGEDGALWLSTYGGLSRFNGKKFTNYTINEGLQTNIVFGTLDFDDTLWISTRDGIDILVNHKLSKFYASPSRGMYYARFYRYDNLFYLLNVNEPTHDKLKNVHQAFDVRKRKLTASFYCHDSIPILGELIPWQDSALCLGSEGLYVTSLRDFKAHKKVVPVLNNDYKTTQLLNGFVAYNRLDDHGVSVGTGLDYVHCSPGFPIAKVLDLKDHKILKNLSFSIPFGKHGFRFLDMDLRLFKIKDGDPNILADISSVHHDYWVSDDYWMLGTDNGFYKLEMGGFEYYRAKDGFPKDVWSALPDSAGRIWFAGFNSRDVFIFDGKKVNPIETNLLKAYYNSAVMGFNHDILFPSHIGASVFKQSGKAHKEITLDKSTLGLARDPLKKLILSGTMDKMYSIDTLYQTKLLFETSEIGPYQTILSILPHDGRYFLAMSKGFGVYDPTTDRGKLLVNKTMRVSDLATDTTGMIWLATDQGLFTWQADSLLPVLPSLIHENLLTIERSNDNRLFIAGVSALFTIDLKKYHKKQPHFLLTYRESAGYEPLEPGQNSFYKDEKGCLWLPTVEHVLKIDPGELIIPHSYPVANMVSAMAVNETFSDSLFFYGDSIITVNYEFNNLSFVFEAVDLDFPESLRFEYMLGGKNQSWLRLSDENNLHFDNLEPGKYTLIVRASRSESFEDVPVAKIQLTVLSPYWMKWWFVTSLVIVAVGLVAGFVILLMQRKQRLERGQLELNRLRSAALSVQIDHHFLANNISRISLLNQQGLIEMAVSYGKYFTRFLQRNMRFLRVEFVTLAEELELVKSYVSMESLVRNNIHLSISIGEGVNPDSISIFPFLIQPLVENSVKYGSHVDEEIQVLIQIIIQSSDELLELSIVNDLPETTSTSFQGNHLALDIIRNRLKIIGGRSGLIINPMNNKFQAIVLIDLVKINQMNQRNENF